MSNGSQLELPLSQRWERRRSTWAPHRSVIDPSRHAVVRISDSEARAFCGEHHYSASTGAQRAAYGLLRKDPWAPEKLVGTIVFGVPMQPASGKRWCGLPADRVCDLNRLVLLQAVEFNGESWFSSRALRMYSVDKCSADIDAMVTYSDPVPRSTVDGRIIMPGHIGTTYQALSFRYVGRSSPRTLYLDNDGLVLSERSLSKIRSGERGASGAMERLLASGAPPMRSDESGADYVSRVLREGPYRRLKHPGNHVYVTSLPGRKSVIRDGLAEALSYPRKAAGFAGSELPLAA